MLNSKSKLATVAHIGLLLSFALGGCSLNLGQDSRFGMFGGRSHQRTPEPPFDVQSTRWETRWYPAHVQWAPDNSHLLVSLCHVNRTEYCRIGKYWLADKRWELLNLRPQTTYRWPSYAPDGKSIVVSTGPCDGNYRCSGKQFELVLLNPDGTLRTILARTIAIHPTFSADGKQLIYWRSNGLIVEVATFDLASKQERMLTNLQIETPWGAPHFVPGGKKYVFLGGFQVPSGNPEVRDGKVARDEHGQVHFPSIKDDTQFDSRLTPPGQRTLFYVGNLEGEVVDKKNFIHLLDVMFSDAGNIVDFTNAGEILHTCNWDCYEKKAAENRSAISASHLAKLMGNKTSALVILRPAKANKEIAEFYLPAGARWPELGGQLVSISTDRRQVAFIENPENFWHFKYRFGIASAGEDEPQFIDWPRLKLDSAATQTTVNIEPEKGADLFFPKMSESKK